MEKKFQWVITQMTTKPKDGDLQDVVIIVNYFRNLIEIDDDGKEWVSQSLGSFECSQPSESDYIPYNDLTEAQVIGWLESGLNVIDIDRYLEANIELQKNPPVIILPNPWDKI